MGLMHNPLSMLNLFKYFKDDLPRVEQDKRHSAGTVGFSEDDVKQLYKSFGAANGKAYRKIAEAMEVSMNSNEDNPNPLDIYPTNAEDAKRMDTLLDEAEKAAVDTEDTFYHRLINEMRGIVGWSNKRHWNCSAPLLIGSMITVVGMLWITFENYWPYKRTKFDYECVKQWTDDPDAPPIAHGGRYESPMEYKEETLEWLHRDYENTQKCLEIEKRNLEKNKTHSKKKMAKESIERYEKELEECEEKIEELTKADLKQLKKIALKETKKAKRKNARPFRWVMLIFLFIIILVPAYIYATHAWGYNIARYREEDKFMAEIQKAAFKFAAAMLGAAAATKLSPPREVVTTTRYSDGSSSVERQTELDAEDMNKMGAMAVYIIIGVVVLGVVSTLIMTYATVTGLMRNYEWSKEPHPGLPLKGQE